jgi:hypothetical protein
LEPKIAARPGVTSYKEGADLRTLEGWGKLSKSGQYICDTRYYLAVIEDEVDVETFTNKLTLAELTETSGTIMPDEDAIRFGEEVELEIAEGTRYMVLVTLDDYPVLNVDVLRQISE